MEIRNQQNLLQTHFTTELVMKLSALIGNIIIGSFADKKL